MKIDRVVWRGLKALESRDDHFAEETGVAPATSLCLRGLNGSGKTTYLETLAALWRGFRRWSQHGGYTQGVRLSPQNLLAYARLAAVHLVELPGPAPSLWLVLGREEEWESVPNRGSDMVAGVLATARPGVRRNLLKRESELYRFWDINATKLEQVGSGSGVPLPNMVMIGAEDRFIEPLQGKDDLFELAPETGFRFLARYEASEDKAGHIENSMSALLAVAPERFAEIAKDLNRVLPNLELLNRADPKKRRPLVKLANGKEVTLEHLSAGERAALIALFTVSRWMTRGGVVMIDEPELHQHVSLIRSNLAVLENYVVDRMGGQLIVASHAPEVWDHFRIRRPIIDLDLPSGGDGA